MRFSMLFTAMLLGGALFLSACTNAIPTLGSLGLQSSSFSLSQGEGTTTQVKVNSGTSSANFSVSCLSSMNNIDISYDNSTWTSLQAIDCTHSPVSVTMNPTFSATSIFTVGTGSGKAQVAYLRATGPNGVQSTTITVTFVQPVFLTPAFSVATNATNSPVALFTFAPGEIAGALPITPDHVYFGTAACPSSYSADPALWENYPPPAPTRPLVSGNNTFYVAYADNAGNISTCVQQLIVYVPSTPSPDILISSIDGPADRTYYPGDTLDFAINWSAPVSVTNTSSIVINDVSTGAQVQSATYDPVRSTPLRSVFTSTSWFANSANGVNLGGFSMPNGVPVGLGGQTVSLSYPPNAYASVKASTQTMPVAQFSSVNSVSQSAGPLQVTLPLNITPAATLPITLTYRYAAAANTATSIANDLGDTTTIHTVIIPAGVTSYDLIVAAPTTANQTGMHAGTIELISAEPARVGQHSTKDIYIDMGSSGTASIVQMSVGPVHGCSVSSTGTLQCWGDNTAGEIGNGQTGTGVTPATPITVSDNSFSKVAVGSDFTCASTIVGTLYCWGANGNHQIDGSATPTFPTPQLMLTTITDFAVGPDFVCAVYDGGDLKCWGANGSAQLGLGNTSTNVALASVTAPILTNVTKVIAGGSHACALIGSGTLQCWGNNDSGQIGAGSTPLVLVPTPPSGTNGMTFENIGASAHAMCAATATGNLVLCSGSAIENGLAVTTQILTSIGVPTPGSSYSTFFSSGLASHMCVNRVSAAPYCWGIADSGAFYDTSTRATSAPIALSRNFSFMAVGPSYSCYTEATALGPQCGGTLPDSFPQLYHALSTAISSNIGRQILQISSASDSTTDVHQSDSCVINKLTTTSGSLECFGTSAGSGQAANSGPVQIFASGISKVAKGSGFTCALREADGEVLCWGQNDKGQLGNGSSAGTTVQEPQLVFSGATDLAATNESVCAARDGEGVWCWGSGTYGAVGIGVIGTNTRLPFETLPTTGSVHLSAGQHHMCALAGAAYCWGDNTLGQVTGVVGGIIPSPTFFNTSQTGGNGVQQIAAGKSHTCVLDSAGAVRCWGNNSASQLGGGTSATLQTATLPSVATSIYASLNNSCAIAGGLLYCWGEHPAGLAPVMTVPSDMGFAPGFTNPLVTNGEFCVTVGSTLQCLGYNHSAIFAPTSNDATNSGRDQGLGFGPNGQRPLLGYVAQ